MGIPPVGPPHPPPPSPIEIPQSLKDALGTAKQIQKLFDGLGSSNENIVLASSNVLKKLLPQLETALSKIPASLGDFSSQIQYFKGIGEKLQSGPLDEKDLPAFEGNVSQLAGELDKILSRISPSQ